MENRTLPAVPPTSSLSVHRSPPTTRPATRRPVAVTSQYDDYGFTTTGPDVILRPPITTQPSETSPTYPPQYTYMPTSPASPERVDASNASIYSDIKPRSGVDSRDSVSLAGPMGSREWSRTLFGAFRDLNVKPNLLLRALRTFCVECITVPCSMCRIARSLGDKPYLPFIPGTGAAFRFKVRILGGIQGSIGDDCLVTCCCCPCAVCQMTRELDDIGLTRS